MPVSAGFSDGGQLPFYVIMNNYPKAKEQLALFKKYGVDLNDKNLAAPYSPHFVAPMEDWKHIEKAPNLYAVAKIEGHEEMASYLEELGVQTDSYPDWKKKQDYYKRRYSKCSVLGGCTIVEP